MVSVRPRPRVLLALAATLVAGLATAPAASAGTVSSVAPCSGCSPELRWTGEPGEDNRVTVWRDETALVVREDAPGARLVTGGRGCVVTGREARCAAERWSWRSVEMHGEDGADVLTGVTPWDSASLHLVGGPGDDELDGPDSGYGTRLDGGPGDDVMRGGPGSADEVSYGDRWTPVEASLETRPAGARNGEAGERDVIGDDVDGLHGGAGDDVLTGDDEHNSIHGAGGRDVVLGLGGPDYLYDWGDSPGDGGDLHGGDGDDTLHAGAHFRLVDGGRGRDRTSGSWSWFSRLSIDALADDGGVQSAYDAWERFVPGGRIVGVEDLAGGESGDRLVGDAGDNALVGDGGADVIHAGAGQDRVEADPSWHSADDFVHVLDGERDVVGCGGGTDTVVADPLDELAECERIDLEERALPEVMLPPLVERPPWSYPYEELPWPPPDSGWMPCGSGGGSGGWCFGTAPPIPGPMPGYWFDAERREAPRAPAPRLVRERKGRVRVLLGPLGRSAPAEVSLAAAPVDGEGRSVRGRSRFVLARRRITTKADGASSVVLRPRGPRRVLRAREVLVLVHFLTKSARGGGGWVVPMP